MDEASRSTPCAGHWHHDWQGIDAPPKLVPMLVALIVAPVSRSFPSTQPSSALRPYTRARPSTRPHAYPFCSNPLSPDFVGTASTSSFLTVACGDPSQRSFTIWATLSSSPCASPWTCVRCQPSAGRDDGNEPLRVATHLFGLGVPHPARDAVALGLVLGVFAAEGAVKADLGGKHGTVRTHRKKTPGKAGVQNAET